jgi:quercetin 2,3-dioxygenase
MTTRSLPAGDFGLHQHENVEIVSYIREGTATHRDNQGNIGKTNAGDVQVMSAGPVPAPLKACMV